MAKNPHREFLKGFSKQLNDHLGMHPEGEDPDLQSSAENEDLDNGGQAPKAHMGPEIDGFKGSASGSESQDGKKKKDAAMALLASNLATKMKGR